MLFEDGFTLKCVLQTPRPNINTFLRSIIIDTVEEVKGNHI